MIMNPVKEPNAARRLTTLQPIPPYLNNAVVENPASNDPHLDPSDAI